MVPSAVKTRLTAQPPGSRHVDTALPAEALDRALAGVPDMSDRMTELSKRFRIVVRARDGGRYMYQIFTVAGETRTFRSAKKSYAAPHEAERAGYEAVAVLKQ
jgi:hypothetical protein